MHMHAKLGWKNMVHFEKSCPFETSISPVTYKTLSILTGGRQASDSFQAAVVTNVATRALAGEGIETIDAAASVQTGVGTTSV